MTITIRSSIRVKPRSSRTTRLRSFPTIDWLLPRTGGCGGSSGYRRPPTERSAPNGGCSAAFSRVRARLKAPSAFADSPIEGVMQIDYSIDELLMQLAEWVASDLHLTVGAPPV